MPTETSVYAPATSTTAIRSSRKSRAKAAAMDLRKEQLAATAVQASASLALAIQVAAGKAIRRHEDVEAAIRKAMVPLGNLVASASVASHLDAQVRVKDIVGRRERPSGFRFAISSVFQTAVDFTRKRLDLTAKELQFIEDAYGANAGRLADELVSLTAREASSLVADAIAQGVPSRTATRRLNEFLETQGMTPENPWRLQTMFRTQTAMAYEAGRWEAMQDPVADAIVWGYEYVTVGDDRVRPNHAAMDGIRLPKDDPFWISNWPPNGWNCRCSTIEILFDDELASAKPPPSGPVEQGGVVTRAQADEGWDFNPGKVYDSIRTK